MFLILKMFSVNLIICYAIYCLYTLIVEGDINKNTLALIFLFDKSRDLQNPWKPSLIRGESGEKADFSPDFGPDSPG